MEKAIDNFLEKVLGGIRPEVNMIVSVIIILIGIIILVIQKKQPSNGKRIAACVLLGIGILAFLFAVIRLVFI